LNRKRPAVLLFKNDTSHRFFTTFPGVPLALLPIKEEGCQVRFLHNSFMVKNLRLPDFLSFVIGGLATDLLRMKNAETEQNMLEFL
jgi:hypothetical protein